MNQTTNCPVCREAGAAQHRWSAKNDLNTEYRYDCPRCGHFILADVLKDGELPGLSDRQRAVLSHRLRRQQRAGSAPPSILRSDLLQLDDPLPTPAEQADNLILWMGDNQPSPAESVVTPEPLASAWIGAPITPNSANSGLHWLLMQGEVTRFLENSRGSLGPTRLALKFAGWQRYEALKHARVESYTAFMAMKFGDEELNRVVNDCFKPAVKATGFELRVLTDGPPA